MSDNQRRILLTGGTGYVGGRLISLLERRGEALRLLARRPDYLRSRVAENHEVVQGDVMDRESFEKGLEGIEVAYYLVHSMGHGGDFEQQDRQAARNFAKAAREKGVGRIIYLGGLGDSGQDLSKHLRSRQEVGEILRESGAEVIELRASIIIGSGSLSFELIRSLVQKLPVMICPRWVATKAQPISIEDILDYLVAALDLDTAGESRVYEIGGPDQVSYGEIMREYANQRNLWRLMISVPLLSPRLSSLWLGLVTPIYARIGRKLVESLRNPTVVTDNRALVDFDIEPMGLSTAIQRAIANEDREAAQTRWQDAVSSARRPSRYGGERFGSRLVDSRATFVEVAPEAAFAPIQRIGGRTGWYYGNVLWRVRGILDLLVGGVGFRRYRRDPEQLAVGDSLDFWRVEEVDPPRKLRLRAEMRLPGRAWLEFEVAPEDGGSRITQTAIFDPVGLFGLAYWYGIYFLHQMVFAGMLRGIAEAARKGEDALGKSVPRSSSTQLDSADRSTARKSVPA